MQRIALIVQISSPLPNSHSSSIIFSLKWPQWLSSYYFCFYSCFPSTLFSTVYPEYTFAIPDGKMSPECLNSSSQLFIALRLKPQILLPAASPTCASGHLHSSHTSLQLPHPTTAFPHVFLAFEVNHLLLYLVNFYSFQFTFQTSAYGTLPSERHFRCLTLLSHTTVLFLQFVIINLFSWSLNKYFSTLSDYRLEKCRRYVL